MRKDQENFIVGLDIGSSMTRMVVGQKIQRSEMEVVEELQILGAAETPTEGVHKGIITSIEDVVSTVSQVVEMTERMAGVPIDNVWVGISGLHIITQNSKGVVAVSKADSEITEEDVVRAVEASRSIATPLNYEVLHVLPRTFNIDGQTGIKDPVGMTGIRLEVDAQIILGSSSQIKNLSKAVYRTGLEIEDVVLSVLANAEAVVTQRQKDLGVVVINLGRSTTSMVSFEEGDVLQTAILPIGSEHITNDLAIGLRTSIDIAEAVKITYGDCSPEVISKREDVDLYELGSQEHEMVKKQYIVEIIQARVEEILRKINQELNKVQRSGLLPGGVVFTGAGAKIPGLIELAKKTLRLPATLGYPLNMLSVTDKVNDLGFATAVGLVKWGSIMDKNTFSQGYDKNGGVRTSLKKASSGISDQVKKWMKTLIP